MKRILVYLFCFSITIQSVLGQFLLFDYSTGSFGLLPCVASLFSHNSETAQTQLAETGDISESDVNSVSGKKSQGAIPGGLKFVHASAIDHLFSPFKIPSKTAAHSFVTFSYLYVGNYSDIFAKEDMINNFIVFYSDFFRIIRIGLPATKLIYPFHYFY